MSRREEIVGWANQQPWPQIGAVVVIGWIPEAVDVIRERRPMCDIIIFDPGDDGEDGEHYQRVTLLDSLRNKVGHRRFPWWDVTAICPPEMQGEHLQPAQAAIINGEQLARCRHLTMVANVVRWTDIGLEVLPQMHGTVPVQHMEGAAEGKHGLIVGAGPSLNQAMFWLPTVQDRLVIAATEAALPVLDRGGVKPDFVVCVEAQDAAYDGLAELSLWSDAILVPGIHASPRAWSLPAKQICPGLQSVGPIGHWLLSALEVRSLDSGGSVSTVAYSVLDRLGVETISGVGLDCGYGPKEQMRAYADGVIGKTKPPVAHEVLPAWGGSGEVASSPQLKTYRDWFGVQVRQHSQRNHINLSVGGARIEGWHEAELSEWVEAVKDNCEPFDRLEIPDKPLDLAWTIGDLTDQLDGIKHAEELCGDAIDAINRVDETMTSLGKLHTMPNATIIAALQMSPLEEMAMLPGPQNMAAAKRVCEGVFGKAKNIVPRIESTIERMKEATNDG
ncbi:MAG: 6-hydroxymethylpterin diphosphokinase MptE-like protein [Planctomycetota bacterium]|jgi:hypothetical protein